jgi:hypothetical protein
MSDEIIECHFCGAENKKPNYDDTIECVKCNESFFTGEEGMGLDEIECPFCGKMFVDEEYFDNEEQEAYCVQCPSCYKDIDVVWSKGPVYFCSYRKEQEEN